MIIFAKILATMWVLLVPMTIILAFLHDTYYSQFLRVRNAYAAYLIITIVASLTWLVIAIWNYQ